LFFVFRPQDARPQAHETGIFNAGDLCKRYNIKGVGIGVIMELHRFFLTLKIAVRERIVNGFAIFQCYHTQVSAKFWDEDPEAVAAIVLCLHAHRRTPGKFAPLTSQVRALAKYLFLEIERRLHCPTSPF
jgi:hypothetical protein